ncbi:MAG: hypothetical protein IRZ28_19940 [Steroidobacteraceae bacterium]|nr:hypothetical protein [Steroidobacteraceae bacterium]
MIDAASRVPLEPLDPLEPLEPLNEIGPEMPAPPASASRTSGAAARPARADEEGPDAAIAPIILGTSTAPAAPARAPAAPPPSAPTMDRDFIARNQIVERYISGRLPIKGATEFERFCREHPELLDELGLPERVNAGLRLLEAAGKPEPWQEEPRKFWEKPVVPLSLGAGVIALAIALGLVWSGSSEKSQRISQLEARIAEQPLEPATRTREIRLLPSFKGGSNTPAVVIGGGETQLADLKIDLSKSRYRSFRITIDRIDQGRVAILHNLQKDSNGHVRVALNSSALGPGNYQFSIEGLTWKGEPVPEAWVTIGVVR